MRYLGFLSIEYTPHPEQPMGHETEVSQTTKKVCLITAQTFRGMPNHALLPLLVLLFPTSETLLKPSIHLQKNHLIHVSFEILNIKKSPRDCKLHAGRDCVYYGHC